MSTAPMPRMTNLPQLKWGSGLNVIAGLWLIISPWVLRFSAVNQTLTGNDVIFGIIVVILAAIRYSGRYEARWLSWINVLIGIWLFVSAFAFSHVGLVGFWNSIILGVIVFILGLTSALATHGRLA